MKKHITLLLLLTMFITLTAQIDINEMANSDPFHRLAQIKETENQLIDYFSDISNPNDTLYVILCPLMFCPRCEGEISIIQEKLYYANPDNQMVLIASYPNEDAAQRYVDKRFEFQDVIYDTDLSFLSFLAFRTTEPRIPFFMKIDRKSGRVLTGGDFININDELIEALIHHEDPMPYYGELWEGQISYNESFSECESDKFKKAETVKKYIIPADPANFISNITFPKINEGFLSFADELDNSIYLYSIPDEDENLVFVDKYFPTKDEEMLFVSEEISENDYKYMKDNNMVIAMVLTSSMINSNTIAFSVSLPNLFYEDRELKNMAYYNAPAAILQSIENADDRKLCPFDFVKHDSTAYISHEDFYFSKDLNLYFFKYSKGYPFFALDEDGQNPFDDGFYENAPLFAIFDTTLNLVDYAGQLNPLFKNIHTAYAYVDQKIHGNGKILAITDGTSGIVSIYDNDNLDNPVSTVQVFPYSTDEVEIDATLYGTEEYAYQFQDYFKDNIIDVNIDDKFLYTLSVENGCRFMKKYKHKGKLIQTKLIPSQINGYSLEISGLGSYKGNVYMVAFYMDKENHYMLFLR